MILVNRWQAVLFLKNGVDRYWRKLAPNAIADGEKAEIRGKLLANAFREPISPIALQIAVLISKMARFDVPKEWPELLPRLADGLRDADDLVQHRCLLVLHHTIKALASKRLAADRRLFHDMVEQMLPFAMRIWEAHHAAFVNVEDESRLAVPLEKATLAIKVLRKSIVHGLRKPHENAEAMNFMASLPAQTRIVLQFRRRFSPATHEALEKYAVLHMKLFTDLLDNHPFSFSPLLRSTLEFVCGVCFPQDASESLLFQRFTIYSLNLIKQVLLCAEYKLPKNPDNVKSDVAEGNRVKSEFFDENTTTEICARIIRDFMPLSQEDLSLWDADPEDYVCEDGGDSWRYSYRPCCESAFLAVFHEHRERLAPVLVRMARENSDPVPAHDLAAILRKDAVYNAVGHAAFDLYDEVSTNSFGLLYFFVLPSI